MNFISKFLVTSCIASLALMPSQAFSGGDSSNHFKFKKKECKCKKTCRQNDPIVGTWLYNLTVDGEVPGVLVNGVLTIHADGTTVAHDSLDLTQALPTFDPIGSYFTVDGGIWKRTGKHRYRVTSTNVLLLRGLDCGDMPACFALPATPFARQKLVTDIVVDSNNQTATASGVATFHPVDDLTLTLPGPFPPATATLALRRLNP